MLGRKVFAILGVLVVLGATVGLAGATVWRVTAVTQENTGTYGWAYAEVDVKYNPQNPYIDYEITYRYGDGGLNEQWYREMILTGNPYIIVTKEYQPNGITVETSAYFSIVRVETVVASAGWPYN